VPIEPHAAITAVVALLAVVGVLGVVIPVLPGSITILAALLTWAIFGGTPWGWLVFGVGAVLVLTGMVSSYVLTGKRLQKRQIPNRSVMVGLVCGVIGLFVLPGFGLPIGFLVGLLASEYLRVRNLRQALSTSWAALTAIGLGMLVGLTCAVTAVTILGVAVVASFL